MGDGVEGPELGTWTRGRDTGMGTGMVVTGTGTGSRGQHRTRGWENRAVGP